MVNDLQCGSGRSGNWKFVDDVTISEGLLRNGEPSVIQSDLTSIATWASNNLMKLNTKKCKEMQICFFRNKPELPHLCVEDQILECVSSHKVLGLIIQDNLKWNEHISMIVTKASKRLHILRVLRRGGIPPHDLITIYYALIRSTLEYCCTVWHCGLPMYLSEQVEKIQKRALRIILPGRSYGEAQEMLQCPRLDIRR
ncbi:RNA-directed DNA polymerase from mobile element jockey, partial [Paramuricea clavata]